MSPTSHCAILRASPMLQAPSRFTSHASGWGELATLPQLHIELGYDERISDIDDPVPVHVAAGEDRKSTRLNSSHLGISYAVFCLKKKKKKKQRKKLRKKKKQNTSNNTRDKQKY